MLWVKLQTPALKIFFWQNTCESLFPTFRPPIWLTTSSKSSITAYSSLFKKFPLRNIFFITKVFKFWRPLLFFYESDIWWSDETKLHLFWRLGVVVITIAQLHLRKPEFSFCSDSIPARNRKICNGENIWRWAGWK